ncbi:MAG: hypothetical protein ABI400_05485 [Lacisediminihabitans sp.]
MTSRWARVARGLVAAVISLFSAASFHIIAGGRTPTILALLSCLVVSTFVCVALSGKKLSLPKLSTAVAVSQFLFHSVFSLWTTNPLSSGVAGRVHDHLLVFIPQALSPVAAESSMWLAHAIAAVATIAALSRGEAAFWSLLTTARLWVGTIFAKLALVIPARTPRPASPVLRVLRRRELLLLFSSLHHRGPPSQMLALLALA